MSLLTRTYTFTDGQTAFGSQVDSEIANITNTLNSLDQGNTTWTKVKLAAIIPTANLDFSSVRLTNIGTPTTAGDAAKYPITNAQITASTIRGSTANSGGSAQEISQGTVSTVDLRTNAVTQVQNSASGSSTDGGGTITTKSITTIGGTILIFATASLATTDGLITGQDQAYVKAQVTRGGTAIPGATSELLSRGYSTTGSAEVFPVVISAIDTPVAGTYTYNFTYDTGSGITGANEYSLVLLELRA